MGNAGYNRQLPWFIMFVIEELRVDFVSNALPIAGGLVKLTVATIPGTTKIHAVQVHGR